MENEQLLDRVQNLLVGMEDRPFIRWSHRVENKVVPLSAQLQDVQAQLAKLENPPSQ